jgi:hypothetical protein
MLAVLAGCGSQRPLPDKAQGGLLAEPAWLESVSAVVTPPVDWHAEPLKRSESHVHQVWLSPTGLTAYGVIHFRLPIPVTDELLVWGFLSHMRRSEGDATLLHKAADPDTGGIAIEAEGGPYRIRATLFSRGWQAWAIYAGTLRNQTIIEAELALAQRARRASARATAR